MTRMNSTITPTTFEPKIFIKGAEYGVWIDANQSKLDISEKIDIIVSRISKSFIGV